VDEDCSRRNCPDGECGTYLEPAGTACNLDGGQVCNGLGDCVECADESQCEGTDICADGQCIPATCNDQSQNGGETDVDCGGPCTGCENGQACDQGADCQSGYCDNGICWPCDEHPDCPDGYCDLVTSICQPGKDDGEDCADAVECASGFCVDSVCCDRICDQTCESCRQAATGGANGTCGPVTADTDPDGECSDAPPCGSTDVCNGSTTTPGCKLVAAGVYCGDSRSCSGGVQTNQDTCDGAGTCADNGTTDCGRYECSGNSCRTSCSDQSHCDASSYCNGSTCEAEKTNGTGCGNDYECASGHCTDGYCCNDACGDPCLNCSTTPGVCSGEDCTCAQQYDTWRLNSYRECSTSSSHCEFYGSRSSSFSCGWLCRQTGGECEDSWNDDVSGDTCEKGTDGNCTATWGGQICRCSRGCGSGPRCPPGQTCSSGSCS
jgi:hypothetical protein